MHSSYNDWYLLSILIAVSFIIHNEPLVTIPEFMLIRSLLVGLLDSFKMGAGYPGINHIIRALKLSTSSHPSHLQVKSPMANDLISYDPVMKPLLKTPKV